MFCLFASLRIHLPPKYNVNLLPNVVRGFLLSQISGFHGEFMLLTRVTN